MAEREESSPFFDKLKKLFSSKSVTVIDSSGRRKVVDVDERQQGSTNWIYDRYTRLHKHYGGEQTPAQSMAYHQVRRELFRDYDAMDADPIIASALDIYADESSLKDEFGNVLKITSNNDRVKDTLENLFYDVLNIEFNLWPWARNMVKYGDFYLFMEIKPESGIINVQPLSVYETERLENTDPKNPNYIKFKTNYSFYGRNEFENYEVAHFRLLSDTNFLPYGKAMVENARRVWKQISLMEDAMLIHRIMRAPEKRIFKIDIGNIPPNEVDNYIQKTISKIKKTPYVDKRTGDYNLKYNMQNLSEDFFLPVRGSDSGTNIESLGGLEYAAIEDIDYLKNKLFAALKIPRAYLGYEENVSGKATIAAEDVRFARTIERIQRTLVAELTKIAIVHLSSQGFDKDEIVDFDLSLVNPSTIYEQEKIGLWSEKIRLVNDMRDLRMISKDWSYRNIFNMSDDEITDQKKKVIQDLKDQFRHDSIQNEGVDPAKADVPNSNGNGNGGGGNGKVGRPTEGNTYGTDDSPFGRDPIGRKENSSLYGLSESDTYNRNAKNMRAKMISSGTDIFGKPYVKKMIKDSKSFLDDSNLLSDD